MARLQIQLIDEEWWRYFWCRRSRQGYCYSSNCGWHDPCFACVNGLFVGCHIECWNVGGHLWKKIAELFKNTRQRLKKSLTVDFSRACCFKTCSRSYRKRLHSSSFSSSLSFASTLSCSPLTKWSFISALSKCFQRNFRSRPLPLSSSSKNTSCKMRRSRASWSVCSRL